MGMDPKQAGYIGGSYACGQKRTKALNLTGEDQVYRLARVLYADEEPLNYTVTYLPEKLFPGLEKHDFEEESLYQVISEQYQATITKARRTVEAVLVKDEIAEYLEIEPGMPVILFGCTTYGEVNGQEKAYREF